MQNNDLQIATKAAVKATLDCDKADDAFSKNPTADNQRACEIADMRWERAELRKKRERSYSRGFDW